MTEYACRIWLRREPEPADWSWRQVQVSRDALRTGGVARLAHFADVTFDDRTVTPLP